MPPIQTKKLNIDEYVDYVSYLNDWYTHKKEHNPAFSYQNFSKACNFKSKSFIAEILKGKKQLSRRSITNFTEGLKLNKRETEYFTNLVFFRTAKTSSEQTLYWEKIKKHRLPGVNRKRTFREFELLENWYTLPVREIISVIDFKEDYKYLGKLVIPSITEKQAKTSVELLIELGLVKKEATLYVQKDFDIYIEPELKKLAGYSFQKSMIQLGAQFLDNRKVQSSDSQTITFGSNKVLNGKLRALMGKFIEDVYHTVLEHPEVEEVQQLNLQFFPLSKDNLTENK
ncbi:MAG: TIGR02147 family protein [Fibrobacterales bacterium]